MVFNKSRKGSLQDLVYIVIAILSFSIFILIGFKLSADFNTEIQANADMPAESKAATAQLVSYYPTTMDNAFLFATIFTSLTTIMLAALVKVHPIFALFFFMGLVIIVFVSGIASNIYTELASNAQMSAQADQLTIISTVLDKLPIFIAVLGTLLMIVMYKTRESD